MKLIYLIIPLMVLAVLPAYANRHEGICFANPDPLFCGILENPFREFIVAPFETIAPGFGQLFIWAPVVFGLWFATKTPAIASIFGLILVSVLTDWSSDEQLAIGVGIVLVAISAGIGLIQIFQRIKQTV